MERLCLLCILLFYRSVFGAVEGIIVNAQLGHVALVGSDAMRQYSNALGLGLEVGVKVNPLLDVQMGIRKSSHSGDLSVLSPTLSAEFHVAQFYDVDMTVGAGPGFYTFSSGANSRTQFGIQFGGATDVVVEEVLRFGVGIRYNSIFDAGVDSPSHWAILMRVGYTFGLSS